MKIFYCGDVFGRPGREAVLDNINDIKTKFKPDVFIANIENSAHGFGSTPTICKEFLKKGVDVLTMGNHTFKQRELIPFLKESKQIIRPINYKGDMPGRGFCEFETAGGKKILIAQALGNVCMIDDVDNAGNKFNELLKSYTLGQNIDAIFIDFHAEVTAEKQAMGAFLDGKVSAVIGSHTHVPTADAKIMPKGTAYMTDAGMCGNYDSVIGSEKEAPIERLLGNVSGGRLTVANGKGTLCGVYIETDNKTGLAKKIKPVQIPSINNSI